MNNLTPDEIKNIKFERLYSMLGGLQIELGNARSFEDRKEIWDRIEEVIAAMDAVYAKNVSK